MMKSIERRTFLRAAAGLALASRTGLTLGQQKTYERELPDTLDLADRAALAINGLTSAVDTSCYESYQCANFNVRPPYMNHTWGGPCLQKPVEALPMLRVMCGSQQNIEVDRKMLDALTRDVEGDGLWWLNLKDHPWRKPFGEDLVYITPHGRLMTAIMTWHQFTGDPELLKIVQRMADGLSKIAIHRDNLAHFGKDGQYFRSGYKSTSEEDAHLQVGIAMRGLAQWAAVGGDEKALDLAGALARQIAQSEFFGTPVDSPNTASAEHGHWRGHYHLKTFNIMGLLKYAIVANDAPMKRLVAGFYEYGRDLGISRIGWYPSIAGVEKDKHRVAEPCNLADMTWIAIQLSDAGVGDYWDDVDQYVRNCLIEYQLTDAKLLQAISDAGPEHKISDPRILTDENVIERNIGTFTSGADPTIAMGVWTMCCVGNCSCALYYAWESIVRGAGDAAQVNLLLNRASPWLDVESYLPYEGKVVLKIKMARKARVRIPMWVDKKAVRCEVNGKEVAADWLGNYAVFDQLEPNDVVTITFPMVETVEHHTEPTYDTSYTCSFRGNTLVDISPRAERPAWTECGQDDGVTTPIIKGYPMWLGREKFRRGKAPMIKKTRYVSPVLIRW